MGITNLANKKPAVVMRRVGVIEKAKKQIWIGLLLPSTLLVTIRLQALTALVFIHLEAAFLFEVAHDKLRKFEVGVGSRTA